MEKISYDQALENARKNVRAKLSFYYHAGIFVVINLLMLAVNLTYSPQVLWFYWPLLGWSIGLATHGFQVFVVRDGSAIKQKMLEKELEKQNHKTPEGQ
ncbi:MAG: 2TM domain-containing protein [Proteobacteria bacterium]|nr:2TM domain-containing protein [Pseudomonadota bacterium]